MSVSKWVNLKIGQLATVSQLVRFNVWFEFPLYGLKK